MSKGQCIARRKILTLEGLGGRSKQQEYIDVV